MQRAVGVGMSGEEITWSRMGGWVNETKNKKK